MSNSKLAAIAVIAGLVLAGGIAALVTESGNSDAKDRFGLTSTKLELTPESEEKLTVWDIPKGKSCSDIGWSSSDSSVVSVTDGTVKAKSLGTATVTAEIKSGGHTFRDTCRITVTDTPEKKMLSYNVQSENMDYAVLSGSGFEKGLLSLTFNVAGNLVVSLPGYDPNWLKHGSLFIGSAESDFTAVDMIITDSSGKQVAHALYSNGRNISPWNGETSDASAEVHSILLPVGGLGYGHYHTVFELKYGDVTERVSGSFEYMRGDGLRDASGTYRISYAWRTDADNSGTVKTCSFVAEYPYGDYVNGLMKSNADSFVYPDALRNYVRYSDAVKFTRSDGTIGILADKLKSEYTKAYGSEKYDDQKFAQFVLTFAQVCFGYEYDHTQYYKNETGYSEKVDFWAFAQQTVFSGHGDCEDTSILLASLYRELGYPAGVAVLPYHMVAAISLDGYSNPVTATVGYGTENGKTYYFCETTVLSPVKYANANWVNTKTMYGYYYAFFLGIIPNTYEGTEFMLVTV